MEVFYYLFAPFILLALALCPFVYAAVFGVLLARRPRLGLLPHAVMLVVLVLLIAPVSLVNEKSGASYGTAWPVPFGIGWLMRGGGAQSLSHDALRQYWQLATILGGICFAGFGLTYCVERLRRLLANRSGR
jgi:hypothetical protein